MATLLEQNELASNPEFIARVKVAMVRTAVELPNQTYPTAQQVDLGAEILAAPDMYAEGFALAVAGLPYIALDSTDEFINYGVNSVFDAVAGSYEYVTDGGAVMPYPVAAVRGKNFKSAAAIPWYLSGGVSAANCLAAYQPKGAADLATSYVNLANPGTYNAAPGTAPTWDAVNGWKFDRTADQWLDSGITPTATTSMLARFTNASATGLVIASYSGNNTTRFGIINLPATNTYFEHAAALDVAGALSSGVVGIAGQQGYLNGATYGGAIPGVWSGVATKTIGIGLQNGNPGADGTFYCQALAFYSVTITAAQVLAISTAMAAL